MTWTSADICEAGFDIATSSFKKWRQSTPCSKATIAAAGPLWGPIAIGIGAGILAIGLTDLALCCGILLSCLSDSRELDLLDGPAMAAIITLNGIGLMCLGFGATILGIPIAIAEASGCTFFPAIQQTASSASAPRINWAKPADTPGVSL